MPYYREDLEIHYLPPGTGGSNELQSAEFSFRSACHIDAATQCRYQGDVLTIACAACGKHIASLVVASRLDEKT